MLDEALARSCVRDIFISDRFKVSFSPQAKSRRTEMTVLYHEDEINNLEDLRRLVEALDEDEGIRVVGNVEGFANGGFIFVSRFREKFCLNICDRVWDEKTETYTVGGRDVWLYFDDVDAAWNRLKSLIAYPLKAWFY